MVSLFGVRTTETSGICYSSAGEHRHLFSALAVYLQYKYDE